MFIETVPNRTSPPAVLLRESYRDEQGRAQKRTLANLSKLPDDVVDGLRALLRGGTVIGTRPDEMRIERSLPHGHVAAALGMLRRIALDRLILSTAKDAASRRHCDLVVAMIVDRLITPRSKLGFVRAVDQETATSSLGAVLRLGEVKEREAYEALDWLLERQQRIENGLARRHLQDGVLVLYDVSSSYFEGRCCPLAQHGYSRDHRGDRPQIVYGVLCTRDGLPVAVEVTPSSATAYLRSTPPKSHLLRSHRCSASKPLTGSLRRPAPQSATASAPAPIMPKNHVQMPPFETFNDAASHAATLAHELTHWTKHPKRLARDMGRVLYGDEGYAKEELVAEIGAAFLCADLGITPEVRPDHARYIASWLDRTEAR